MRGKRIGVAWVLVFSIACVFVALGVYLRVYLHNMERFPDNYVVCGVDVSGKDREEAKEALASIFGSLDTTLLTLQYGAKQWSLNPRDVGFRIDVSRTVDDAFMSLLDPRFSDFFPIRIALEHAKAPELVYTLDTQALRDTLTRFDADVAVPPKNAMLLMNPDETVSVIHSQTGIGIDIPWAIEEIRKMLLSTRGRTVILRSAVLQPAVSTQQLTSMGITGLISEYRTEFNADDHDRTHNLALAARALDGALVRPGEVFSFNHTVGPRTNVEGYKEAGVVVDYQTVSGLGGGVCQVSTTLYNAALLANLKITERHRHSLPVTYVSPGRDATVTYDYLDLKITNALDTHVLIRASVVGKEVVVKLYGKPKPNERVYVKVTEYENLPYATIEVDDPSLPKDTTRVEAEGFPGYRAVVTRIVERNGQEAKRERISEDICPPRDRIVRVGTGVDSASHTESNLLRLGT